ncbi:OmpA family protein [Pseudomonas sp. BGr12]|uniref:OmpA family protein n=1 Tax=unclassified Pseudomonas TaxID=196821 RepID=UPI001787376B|nr:MULTISPECIES: OmpA family protein [unclassified Pseudomonas]MBD9502877.1 OmpA family protein [Pseudomonas sp. PDM17]MBD9574648.1 OmpA family protein [Pseudomonas sp. PDM23]MBD9673931.1 OmpA family protein [Pseudomonas sp. PDM21]MDL2426105.1 OmpA family protein [Pseudomonas sp. BJa5]
MLFRFGKSDYNDRTAEGHAQLRQVVQEIKGKSQNVTGIEVVGHADPIGKAQANPLLSQRRAETVRKVLLELGLQSLLVHISGRSSSEPVVSCGTTRNAANIACNSPNRRVELVIQGQQGDWQALR